MTDADRELRYGFWCGLGAYGAWGLFPLYFLPLSGRVPALEVVAHRVLWAMPFLALVLWTRDGVRPALAALRDGSKLRPLLLSSGLIAVNWLVYVYSVTNKMIFEASFGYFVTPLLNVAVGALLLRERLRHGQWLAVGFAVAGVATMGTMLGAVPWLSLGLACSFAAYGLCRKRLPFDAANGLFLETLLWWPIAVGYLIWLAARGATHFTGGTTVALLVGSGPVTAIPLLLFAGAARRLPFSTIGFLQFLGPALQALIGWQQGEAFERPRQWGFGLLAVAVALFVVDLLRVRHAAQSRSLDSFGGNSTSK